MRKRLVALLPMKAHSERVPRKNFRPLAGKPTVRWILDTLLAVDAVDLVVINTDARRELDEVGVRDSERVLIRDRRAEICGDMVSMNLVLADDVAAVPADRYLMTHTTNPLLQARTIERALERFDDESERCDSLFTVNRIQTRFYDGSGEPVNHDPNNLIRTQDLEPWFEENSCLYLFTAESFAATNARIGRRPLLFETPRLESTDIDDMEDWFAAEALLEKAKRDGLPGAEAGA